MKMQVTFLFFFSIILIGLGIVAYNKMTAPNNLSIEMVAFNGLTKEEQKLIPTSPKDSTVKKISVDDEIKPYVNKDYDKNEVYSITFHNVVEQQMTVYVSLDKKSVVGKKIVDE